MASAINRIQSDAYVFLQLPSDLLRVVQCKPDTIIDLGRLGSFPINLLLGRPYYHTYELLEKQDDELFSRLRIVPPQELNAEATVADADPSDTRDDTKESATDGTRDGGEGFDLVAEDGRVIMKNNRLTIDDASRQTLSQAEIEELKKSAGGREIVDKILASHTALDEKSDFSKAKYTLRKTKKYLKRFSVLPMELCYLIDYVLAKEPSRILDMREEPLGLVCSWSNAHYTGAHDVHKDAHGTQIGGGRLLVVDDAGGLVVAALAERKGILRLCDTETQADDAIPHDRCKNGETTAGNNVGVQVDSLDKTIEHRDFPNPSETNSITVVHAATQPNVSLLKYFGYDTNQPDPDHPLHTHLRTLSWLQLLHPEDDQLYREPEQVDAQTLEKWKSGKRGNYFKKRRRWERCKGIIDETRAGGFDGLVIASHMDPLSILPHAVPLIRGGGHIVIYSPTVDPLVKVMDVYSKERRTAYINHITQHPEITPDADDFPVDPRLLLAPTLQTSRIRDWQVLPGRTHPLMTSRGGSEGYVFTARRVIPLEGGVEARGNFSKRRKVETYQSEGDV